MLPYLDHNATTPCDPQVLEEMLPFYSEIFWNASSIHALGRRASKFLDQARERCAAVFDRAADEIVFTSGATDGIQLCLESLPSDVIEALPIYYSEIEHRAVKNALHRLALRGARLSSLPTVGGLIDLDAISEPGLYVIQAANSETGAVQPIEEIARIVQDKGGFFICDAAQALWKLDAPRFANHADAVIVSAHKAYGPKGSGLLMLRPDLKKLLRRGRLGDAQEQGLREGTHNVAAVIGMAATAELVSRNGHSWRSRSLAARSAFEQSFQGSDRVAINFERVPRIPNTSSVRLYGVDGDVAVLNSGLAISYGSACSSGTPGPSPALLASGLDRTAATQTVRVSFGKDHEEEDGHVAAQRLLACAERLTASQ